MNRNDKANSIIAEAARAAAQSILDQYDVVKPLCGSPIEEILLAQLIADQEAYGEYCKLHFYLRQFEYPREPIFPGCGIDVTLQTGVGPYRVDFLFDDHSVPNLRQFIVVECDGHDFHEKTKEQARHDKKRDRYFTALGWKVLRFTGSEIFNDPEEVSSEIFSHLNFNENSTWAR